jgi:hypothetical protein
MLNDVFAGYGLEVKTTNNMPYMSIVSNQYAIADQHGRKYADGELRYSGFGLEVYANGTWNKILGNNASVALSHEMHDLVYWVRQQQEKERKLNELIKTYPALQDAKHNLDAMIALLSDYKENNP